MLKHNKPLRTQDKIDEEIPPLFCYDRLFKFTMYKDIQQTICAVRANNKKNI